MSNARFNAPRARNTPASLLTDDQLVAEVVRLASRERDVTVDLISHLAEFDARRLYLGAGFSSLFTYCTGVLRLAEHAAYNRIEAARASRRFPVILERLRDSALNLATVRLLAPHLTDDNHEILIDEATGGSKREVEELVARHFPQSTVAEAVRKLPAAKQVQGAPSLGSTTAAPASVANAAPSFSQLPSTAPPLSSSAPVAKGPASFHRAAMAPLSADQYKVTFTASAETRDKLRRAQDLLRHRIPDGGLAAIFDRALSALLTQLERTKFAATNRPRSAGPTRVGSRHIPAEVRRAVWTRDGGRCAFVAKDGRRCQARGFLEFHHARPYAVGGEALAANIALRCGGHNGYEAEVYFGPARAWQEQIATRPGGG